MLIANNINNVKIKIAQTADKAGRRFGDITLVYVTKQVPVEVAKEAVSAGANIIGESRVEDAILKKGKLPADVKIHMIGHLQSRKAKDAVRIFDLIHSVDSVSLAEEINKRAEIINKVQRILLEVNVSGEKSKYGFTPKDVMDGIKKIAELKNVKVLGLMTMAPFSDDTETVRPVFRALKQLSEKIKNQNIANVEMKYLSMGMTQDYAVAIEEGSNMIRIGTAIFKNDK